MGIIGSDEVGVLDEKLKLMFQTLIQSKKASTADAEAARRLLEWVIYPDWDTASVELDVRPIEWSRGINAGERDLLKHVVRAAAALAKSGKDRDKADLVQRTTELLKARGIAFGSDVEQPKKLDRKTEARDKFVYQKACKGMAAKQILSLIDQHPDWDPFQTDREVKECATRYAQRHNLPLPP